MEELADSRQQYSGYAWRDAIATARGDHVRIVYPRAGTVWRTEDGVTLTFIGLSLPFIESSNTIDDNSIAFILQYKQFRMPTCSQSVPRYAIISVGRHNMFGHPAPSTIEALQRFGARVYPDEGRGESLGSGLCRCRFGSLKAYLRIRQAQ